MKAELVKTFRFDAAHALSGAPEDHKCRQLHGHSYRADIHVTGMVDPHAGWVMDFGELTRLVRPIVQHLDHKFLNDVPGLENCTAELLAKYLWDRIKPLIPQLSAVTVWESETARAVYCGQ